MRYIHKAILGLLCALLPAFCGLYSTVGLSQLLNQADAVVVASVNGSSATGTVTVDLTVQRVLKGSIPIMSTLTSELAQNDTSPHVLSNLTRELSTGKTGIWFLQQLGTTWQILPIAGGDIYPNDLYIHIPSTDLPAAYGYDSATDPRKKLVLELEAAAFDPTTSNVVSKLAARKMFDDGLGMETLQSFNSALASSSQTTPRVIGLAGEIKAGQPSSITTLVTMPWSTLPSNLQGILTRAVCEYRGTDLAAIPGLATLSESAPLPRMQECATHALREIHTKKTLPFLEKLLDSSNARIRYDAVIGIAQFAMSFPIAKSGQKAAVLANFTFPKDVTAEMSQNYPATDVFAKNEGQYISYWKHWLHSHRTQ